LTRLARGAPLLLVALRPTWSVMLLVGGSVPFVPALLIAVPLRALVRVGYFGVARNDLRSVLTLRPGGRRLVDALSRRSTERALLYVCLINANPGGRRGARRRRRVLVAVPAFRRPRHGDPDLGVPARGPGRVPVGTHPGQLAGRPCHRGAAPAVRRWRAAPGSQVTARPGPPPRRDAGRPGSDAGRRLTRPARAPISGRGRPGSRGYADHGHLLIVPVQVTGRQVGGSSVDACGGHAAQLLLQLGDLVT